LTAIIIMFVDIMLNVFSVFRW